LFIQVFKGFQQKANSGILIILILEVYPMGAFEVFSIVAAGIALVFLSWALFRMTRFPPGVLFVILGAVLSLIGSHIPIVLSDTVSLATPILLGAVLFGCGLKINLLGVAKHKGSFLLSILVLLGVTAATGGISFYLLGLGLAGAILVGAICASACSFFVFHIVDAINIEGHVADTLMLESSLTEAGAVMLALAVFLVTSGASAPQAIAFGMVFGLLAGIVWVRLLRFTSDFPHRDALTLSLVLGVAAFCEMVFQDSGIVSAFFFGLAMGNSPLLRAKISFEGLLRFQEDVVMTGGTFFFFYAGLKLFGLNYWMLLFGALLFVVALIIRMVAVYIAVPEYGFSLPISGISPKGLSAILIAQAAIAFSLPAGEKVFAIAVPVVALSSALAGYSAGQLEGKKPPKLEEVAKVRGPPPDPAATEGHIAHAYDIEELKRTINGKSPG
jgi:NhaP-type Na+/H+ or K+/H+ antiporter